VLVPYRKDVEDEKQFLQSWRVEQTQ